jgi:hypothetical protein
MNFIFVGRASKGGELPIVGLEWEGFMNDNGTLEGQFSAFLKYPSFDLYLGDVLEQLGDGVSDVDRMPGFRAEMRALLAANRNLTV